MSRHQMPRHTRRRLTIAAIAATALIGGTVTVGIMGIASGAEDGQGGLPSAAECQVEAPPAEEPPAEEPPAEEPPAEDPGAEDPGAEDPGDGQGEEQPPAEDPGDGQGEEQPPAEDPGAGQGEEQPPAEDPGAGQGEEQPVPEQTYGVTAPQAAHPDNPAEADPNAEQPPAEDPGDGQGEEQPPAEDPGDGQGEEQPPAEDPGDGQGEEEPPAEDPGDGQGEEQPPAEEEPPAEDPGEGEGELDPNCVGPFAEDFVDIANVQPGAVVQPQAGENASTGSVTKDCGVNNGFINSDNFIAAPGVVNGAEHQHHQVGNLNSNANSNENNLVGAGTSCADGDESTYFWPLIRLRNADPAQDQALDQANPHNIGEPIEATSAELKFKGNEQSPVVAMPQFLRVITGDAKAANENLGKGNDNAKWTCSGQEDRVATDKYTLCPEGSQTVRISNFPSCWDGQNVDSADHRSHIVFKDEATGACPEGTQAVPELQITLSYDIPPGQAFAVDSFPKDLHAPITDHNDFVNVMNEQQMQQVVDTINGGQQG